VDAFLDEARALKSKPGKDIVATGGITLVHALTAAGLVDEDTASHGIRC
jgi:hypothetical protein